MYLKFIRHQYRLQSIQCRFINSFSYTTAKNTIIYDNNQENKDYEVKKITYIGSFMNLSMATSKGIVGIMTNSHALLADAAHSLSDLLSDFITLWSFKISRKPPDIHHPYGYGKFEALGSLTIGAFLITGGLSIAYDSALSMYLLSNNQVMPMIYKIDLPIELLSKCSKETQLYIAAGLASVSVAIKEILYRTTLSIGKKNNSKSVIANAWHHRTDAISSLIALIGICGNFYSLPILDSLAGVIVAGMIVKAGSSICLESVRELTDKGVDAIKLQKIYTIAKAIPDIISVSDIRARHTGPYTLVDLKIALHPATTITAAEHIIWRVKSYLLSEFPEIIEVLVRIEVDKTERHDDLHFNDCQKVESIVENSRKGEYSFLRPYKEIKSDIEEILQDIPEIERITHLHVHWFPSKQGPRTGLDIVISVSPDISVMETHRMSKIARRRLMEIPYISDVDIHLELQDKDGPSNANVM